MLSSLRRLHPSEMPSAFVLPMELGPWRGLPFKTAVRTWSYMRMDSPYVAMVPCDCATSVLCPYLGRLELVHSFQHNQPTVEDRAEVLWGHRFVSAIIGMHWRNPSRSRGREIRRSASSFARRSGRDILRLLNNSVAAMEAAPNEEAWGIVGRAVRSLQLTLSPLLIHPLLQRTVGVESLVDESVVWYLG